MTSNKKILSMVGIFFGVAVVFFGLLVKDSGDGSIVISNNILKNFYISNRNLEDPVFIKFDNLLIRFIPTFISWIPYYS